jgi:hypothetical protein
VANVNAALDGLTFQPHADTSTLTIAAADPGTGGVGGPQSATASVSITQIPLINPAPGAATDPTRNNRNQSNPLPIAVDARHVAPAQEAPKPVLDYHDSIPAPRARPTTIGGPAQTLQQQQDAERKLATSVEEVVLVAQADARLGKGASLAARRAGFADLDVLWGNLQSIANQFKGDGEAADLTIGAAAGLTAVLGAGYAIWSLRAGTLLASVLSSLPVWGNFDPLPVLEYWDRKGRGGADDDDDQRESYLAQRLSESEERAAH